MHEMDEPLTEELLNELLSSPDPLAYLHEHEQVLHPRELAAYLQQLADARQLQRKDVVREAQINPTYGYQLFTGARTNPSRDLVLQLAFALRATPLETDRLLQAAGASKLYCKDRRDAIVIFCLNKGTSLMQANEALYNLGEKTLGE